MTMKKILLFLPFILLVLASCGKGSLAFTGGYDAGECAALAVKIERHDSLTQDDYAIMIEQNEAILQYLIDRASEISELPDSCRYGAWRVLVAEPEYLERFGYMFTLGSALYQAEIRGRLNEDNAEAYGALDDYNSLLADYTDRF